MKRRTFLAGAMAAGLSRSAFAAHPKPRRAQVASDVDPLRKVLVHTPGAEVRKPVFAKLPPPAERVGRSVVNAPLTEAGMDQHRAFVKRLTDARAEVVLFHDALDDAIARATRAGRFEFWVEENLPALIGREDEITASVLIGAKGLVNDAPDEDGAAQPVVTPLVLMYFTRDIGTMTPQGVVLANIHKKIRSFEPALLRFALRWSPRLKGYPIAFDALAQGIPLQGGDMIVLDERTLLLGVGNVSAEAAARPLARRLGMDVIAVQLPGSKAARKGEVAGGWDALRSFFLHLDSVFNLVDPRRALVVPYFLEEKYATREVMEAIAKGCPALVEDGERTWADLREIGRVRRYQARSGEVDAGLGEMKLVDYLRTRGFEFLHVGGPAPDALDIDYLRSRAVPEAFGQGANVLALGPGRVIAFEGNPHTMGGLKAGGVDVATFPCSDLVRWHGGPHCMSLPLERGRR